MLFWMFVLQMTQAVSRGRHVPQNALLQLLPRVSSAACFNLLQRLEVPDGFTVLETFIDTLERDDELKGLVKLTGGTSRCLSTRLLMWMLWFLPLWQKPENILNFIVWPQNVTSEPPWRKYAVFFSESADCCPRGNALFDYRSSAAVRLKLRNQLSFRLATWFVNLLACVSLVSSRLKVPRCQMCFFCF